MKRYFLTLIKGVLSTMSWKKCLILFFSVFTVLSLSGCKGGIWSPMGIVAAKEKNLMILATILMLIVVIPVILLTLWFAWRYREGANAKYAPKWAHSTKLEIVCWGVPFIIILILSIITWVSTHSLSPYKPLKSDKPAIEIDVVALDWKWMFIYPKYNIATVNFIEIPKDRSVHFKITSAAPMNSFFIPELGSQIYAMAGMTTQLYLKADHNGKYRGFSANYTGAGFAEMQFYTKVVNQDDFDSWVNQVKNGKHSDLTWDYFWSKLVKPSTADPVSYYSNVDKGLFGDIVKYYMIPNYKPGSMQKMQHMDM